MTDPARTTKEWREHTILALSNVEHDPDERVSILADQLWRVTKDADAADALRAQVAALQAENERLAHEVLGWEVCKGHWTGTITLLESELAAAQAKLAVPVPAVLDLRCHVLRKQGPVEHATADMLEALARDNAALRTKAEALERERDWLDHNTTFYDVTNDAPVLGGNVPTLASVSKRIWYHATDDQDSYPFSAVIAAALAEKP